MSDTARRAFVASIVVLGVVVGALALWKLKILLALLFLAFTVAAAMRPGVEALRRRGFPRGARAPPLGSRPARGQPGAARNRGFRGRNRPEGTAAGLAGPPP